MSGFLPDVGYDVHGTIRPRAAPAFHPVDILCSFRLSSATKSGKKSPFSFMRLKLAKGSVRILRDGGLIALAKKGDSTFPHYVFRLAGGSGPSTPSGKRPLDDGGLVSPSGSGADAKRQKVDDTGGASTSTSKDAEDEEMDLMCIGKLQSLQSQFHFAIERLLLRTTSPSKPRCRSTSNPIILGEILTGTLPYLSYYGDKCWSRSHPPNVLRSDLWRSMRIRRGPKDEEDDMIKRGLIGSGELRLVKAAEDDESDGSYESAEEEEEEDDDGRTISVFWFICTPITQAHSTCQKRWRRFPVRDSAEAKKSQCSVYFQRFCCYTLPGGCTNPTCETDYKMIGDHDFAPYRKTCATDLRREGTDGTVGSVERNRKRPTERLNHICENTSTAKRT
ncbi:hypothetical protein M427DRAFT_44906 [Gonapodya prolifera JEL478]|uniref:Uncharacterized protein n=1 Tax=Gonapodya prolifera (strain JEL478) TaxID=1344416 RepID=A0A139AD32_GONPJ|nr:hypothetical protein M427DRAFT_44906 [Gonapodya prolifera JEL478]|eukprot:KXS14722.1 hypothetical protein M427DRAFT_44906 [Gonapodya prolifera JEL478]